MTSKSEISAWHKGCLFFESNNIPSAISHWRSVADYSKIHFNLAVAFTHSNYIDDALDSLLRAIACDPHSAIAYALRAQIYQAHNEPSLAAGIVYFVNAR
jgi:Tfp pilus assembly protein PilF